MLSGCWLLVSGVLFAVCCALQLSLVVLLSSVLVCWLMYVACECRVLIGVCCRLSVVCCVLCVVFVACRLL